MLPALRSIAALFIGLLVNLLLLISLESLGRGLFPSLNAEDPEALREALAAAPLAAFGFLLVSYAVGSFCASWTAAYLAGRAPVVHALIVGSLLTVLGVINLVLIPHPVWFWIPSVGVFLPFAYLAGLLNRR